MSIEAMKQALKAFEVATTPLARDRQEVLRAQAALRQAIEQAEKQEPVIGTKTWYEDGKVITQNLYPSDVYKQEKQEPVCDTDPRGCWSVRCQLGNKCKNTPAPHRAWVGLTNEEIDGLVANTRWHELIKATEAKLKEKNT